MSNKSYILAVFAFSLTFFGQAEANGIHKNLSNRFERLNVLKMGPLDPRELDKSENTPPSEDDVSQDASELN
jgi:hypothetical protein